jgi:archaemetzincin
MRRLVEFAAVLACAACLAGRAPAQDDELFVRLAEPRPGDWRQVFDEPAQTFEDYQAVAGRALGFTERRIRLLPLGPRVEGDDEILARAGALLAAYYMTRVEFEPRRAMPDEVARRATRGYGPQFRAEDILRCLAGEMPEGTVARLIVTPCDLYAASPAGLALSFVFGMGGGGRRTGVVSLARYGVRYASAPPGADLVRRALKVAVHETGHVFGLAHCATYACGMNGSNSLAESDSRPIHLCPECLRKIGWHFDCDLAVRYDALARVYRDLGWADEAAFAARRASGARAGRMPGRTAP